MFNYNHPTLVVEFPAPGHYSVHGLPQQTVFIEGEGHIVAPETCYISPAVPDDFLEAVLRDRADRRTRGEETAPEKAGRVQMLKPPEAAKRGRGRPVKAPKSVREVVPDEESAAPLKPLEPAAKQNQEPAQVATGALATPVEK